MDKQGVYSIYGDKLNDDLINFTEKLNEKMMDYCQQIEQGIKPEKVKMKPLLVLADTYSGRSFQATIVKFKGFQSRTDVYRARFKNKDSKV